MCQRNDVGTVGDYNGVGSAIVKGNRLGAPVSNRGKNAIGIAVFQHEVVVFIVHRSNSTQLIEILLTVISVFQYIGGTGATKNPHGFIVEGVDRIGTVQLNVLTTFVLELDGHIVFHDQPLLQV